MSKNPESQFKRKEETMQYSKKKKSIQASNKIGLKETKEDIM